MNALEQLFSQWGTPVLFAAWALPVAAALAVWVLGRRLGAYTSTVMVTALAAAAVGGLYVAAHAWLLPRPLDHHPHALWLGISQGPQFVLGAWLTNTTALLFALVALVAAGVGVFAAEYLKADPSLPRFWAWLGLFVGAMQGVVLADNLILLFICWELVGLASWALIGFWHTKPQAAVASTTAFLANRVADVALLAAVLLLLGVFSTTDLELLRRLMQSSSLANGQWLSSYQLPGSGVVQVALPQGWVTAVGVLLCVGALGKSAQGLFMGWLPRAMAGPTPASALLHAATMVAAGVVLLARVYPLLDGPTLHLLAWVGAVTALAAAACAAVQTDLKRVLAFSTASQLGLMVMGLGVWAQNDALLHLVAHAFFKAGLFVAVGVAAGQGISRLHLGGTGLARAGSGGRWLAVAFALDAAALAGLPLTSGFLGKEGILAGAFGWASTSGGALAWGVPLLALAASGLTAFYTLRMWLGAFAGGAGQQAQPFRLPVGYALPLALFAVGALGVCFGPNPFDPDASWVVSALPPVVNASVPVAATEPSLYEARAAATAARGQLGGVAMLATLGATALGLGFAWFRWRGKRPQTARPTHRVASALHRLLENGWGLGAAYDALGRCIIAVGQALAWVDGRALDRIWLSLAHWVGGHSGPSRYAPHISPDPPPFGPPLSLAAVAAATDQHVIDKAYTALAQAAQALGSAARNPRRGQAQAYLMRALVALLALAAGWALWQWVL